TTLIQRILEAKNDSILFMHDVLENRNYIPTREEGTKIPKSSWNEDKKMRYLLNSKVKDSKISMIVHKYELFKMKDHESIDQMFGRFQIISIMRKKLPMEEFLGTLKIHEIELNEDEDHQKGKSTAFKA
ncbi:hypothetical protein CR513_41368, partial [Mucuna pruriens]